MLIITALCLFGLGYFTIFDGTITRKVITFESTELVTTQDVYRPGDVVQAPVSFCKKRPIIPEVQWSLIDTYLKLYAEESRGTPATGCHEVIFDIEKIPADSYPGTYHFVGKLKYKANPFRTIEYVLSTNYFKVIR